MFAIVPILEVPKAASHPPVDVRSIDELDAAICNLARRLHAETYRFLLLLLHEGGFSIRRRHDGTLDFRREGAATYRFRPDPATG